jgi:hypothetical protein
VAENDQILMIARMRAEAEDVYGMRLGEIGALLIGYRPGFLEMTGRALERFVLAQHVVAS